LLPRFSIESATRSEKMESLSKMRKRGAVSSGNASRSRCMTQNEVGCSVTAKWRISLRPCPITNQAWGSRDPAVGATRKSIAAMSCL
jgi:hypothetical protein